MREWVHKRYAEMLRKSMSIRLGAWILEPGCGTAGASAILAADNQVRFVGLDIDLKALKKAKGKIEEENVSDLCDLVQGDMFHLPFRDGAYDLAWNAAVLEHFQPPQDEDAIREMTRVTKPSGKIFVLVPNRFHLWAFKVSVLYKLIRRCPAYGYQRHYSIWELERKFERTGLVVKKSFGFKLGWRSLALTFRIGKIYDVIERRHTRLHKIFGQWIAVVGIKPEYYNSAL